MASKWFAPLSTAVLGVRFISNRSYCDGDEVVANPCEKYNTILQVRNKYAKLRCDHIRDLMLIS